MKGLITEIQKSSVHDGPGMRTVVFMKGCNMRCAWCHNPETVYGGPEILLAPDKCIGCGECENGCFAGAKVACGVDWSVEQIFSVILEDQPYYGKKGGVTVSGGEPLCQREFVTALLARCRRAGIHTAIETNLNFDTDQIMQVCGQADMIMCDCKMFDEEKHIRYTGVSNVKVLQNLYEIDRLNVPIIVRTPVIEGVNSSQEEIGRIAGFIKNMKNIRAYELLTYHPLGLSKPASAHFTPVKFEKPSKETMRALAGLAIQCGLRVFVDNVPVTEEVCGNANI